MADAILQPSTISRAVASTINNMSGFLPRINKQYEAKFGQGTTPKIGDTLKLRRQVQFTTRTGNTASLQDVKEYSNDLAIVNIVGVDFDFLESDLTLKIEDFNDRYVVPASATIASAIDLDIATQVKNAVSNFEGTRGTTPATMLPYLNAGAKLTNYGALRDGNRHVLLHPTHEAATINGLNALFNSQKQVATQYEDGTMGTMGGFKFAASQNLTSHTVGPMGGTPLVNGASQVTTGWANTQSLITDGWTAAAAARVKKGDWFTMAGVYAVNQMTKVSTGVLQQFVITADGSSDGSGNLTLTISPAIITTGAYQNVSAAPADNVALTFTGNGTASTEYTESVAFHKNAISFAAVDLSIPKGMDMAARSVMDGVSVRLVRGFDITENRYISRLDVMYGLAIVRPEHIVRITG